jgi:predicted RNA binding protein YcfA (HicA-like mRNA interferase family)
MRALGRAGFALERVKGSHYEFVFPGRRERVAIVPNHPGDLERPLVMAIIKQARLTVEEFITLL